MKAFLLISIFLGITCLSLLGGCSTNCTVRDCRNNSYSYETNARTSPSVCDSSCADPCNLLCDNDNTNYRGCGDNCVMH